MATYFADTSFWIAISSRRDQYHSQAVAWHQFLLRTESGIVTTEAVLWEWLNALAGYTTRDIAAEGYRRDESALLPICRSANRTARLPPCASRPGTH
jgi:predicted nucleic acid-binding protein